MICNLRVACFYFFPTLFLANTHAYTHCVCTSVDLVKSEFLKTETREVLGFLMQTENKLNSGSFTMVTVRIIVEHNCGVAETTLRF